MNDDQKRFERLHALIVDEEQAMISIITTILQSMGITNIERAMDGNKALELLQEDGNIVHFVVCEWTLPGMTGLQLLKKIREMNPAMPVLMLSGDSSIDNVKAAMAAGVSQYLMKPFTSGDMQKRVRAMTKNLAV
jgi:two-component system chemotaxis response regulator CheY